MNVEKIDIRNNVWFKYTMIIPIKCFTCGTLIADKYRLYVEQVHEKKLEMGISETVYFNSSNNSKTIEGEMMDKLGLVKQCCRRHMLTHVDIE
jgi:DNA-directed RNA polymerase subunit N (RpoN/RPB10)